MFFSTVASRSDGDQIVGALHVVCGLCLGSGVVGRLVGGVGSCSRDIRVGFEAGGRRWTVLGGGGVVDAADGGVALLKVVRGRASDEELAALAVTLFSLAAGRVPERNVGGVDHRRRVVAWRPPEHARVYRAPHSWR
ncbi:acyl-CoA carboxylase subunit epsilon [Streptomyces sp. NPDC029674]|uniref:acyl-CoA carboxylase subunit epsilon n=1 Tax=Streptomyces sp. NPDC029674 TaxID=3365297 RepID=UPI00384DE283